MKDIDEKVGIDYPGFVAKQDDKVVASARNFKVLLDKDIVKQSLGKKGFVLGQISQKGIFQIFTHEQFRAHLSPL